VHEERGIDALRQALKAGSPRLYESLEDKSNSRRLIRALELSEAGVETLPNTWRRAADTGSASGAPAGLRLPQDQLRSRIESRVVEMYRQGLLDEVRRLLEAGPALSATARKAIGYAEAIDVLAGRCSREEAIQRTAQRTGRLARRQRTWFRHQTDVRWIDSRLEMTVEAIAEQVMDHWRTHGPTQIAT
jgi:tRNA dimethylallyltransferase